MKFRSRKALGTVREVQVFLDTNNDRLAPVNAGGARAALNDVVVNLETLAGKMDPTKYQLRREQELERNARYELREVQMKPIAKVAELSLRTVPEFDHLRMPTDRTDTAASVRWAREMAKAAEPHAQIFFDHGLSQDFLTKLLTAADVAQRAVAERRQAANQRVGVTTEMHTQTRRALGIIAVLDALVAPLLKSNDLLAREWEVTKRVARRAVTAAADETAPNGGDPPAPPVPVEPPVPVVPPAPSEHNAIPAPAKEDAA